MTASAPVSVVIPVYNGARFVRDAIESVFAQTMPALELIVVDDGSTDETPEILGAYGDRIRVLRKPNGGVASARNAGTALARGEFVAFLDADDVWLPEKLARQMPLFSDPEVALVYSGVRVVNERLRPVRDVIPAAPERALINALCAEPPPAPITMTGIVRRSVLNDIGGFDERLSTAADADFLCRVALGSRVDRIKEPLALYRQHSGQMHLNIRAMEHDMLLIHEKVFADPRAIPLRSLRGRARANLYYTFAAVCFHERSFKRAIGHGIVAVRSQPGRVLQLLVNALARVGRATIARRR